MLREKNRKEPCGWDRKALFLCNRTNQVLLFWLFGLLVLRVGRVFNAPCKKEYTTHIAKSQALFLFLDKKKQKKPYHT